MRAGCFRARKRMLLGGRYFEIDLPVGANSVCRLVHGDNVGDCLF